MAIELFVSPHAKPPRKKKPRLNTRACKAKGRRLQDYFREALHRIGAKVGLEADDIKAAIMGMAGVDIVFSPAAAKHFKLDVECKNVERLRVVPTFWKHYKTYASRDTVKVLVHKINFNDALITLRLDDFLPIYERYVLTNVLPGRAVGEHHAEESK